MINEEEANLSIFQLFFQRTYCFDIRLGLVYQHGKFVVIISQDDVSIVLLDCLSFFESMSSICILALSYLASLTSVTRADVTFGIASQVTTGNHLTYNSNVQGLCVDILVSTDACTVTQDCSHMSSFECSSVSTSTIDIDADGVVTMSFDASVAEPYDECGESSCPACTAYKSCVGPMVQTDQQTLNAGDCILWEYSTTGGSDAFEVGFRQFWGLKKNGGVWPVFF